MLYKFPNNLVQVDTQYLPNYMVGYEHFLYNNSDELYPLGYSGDFGDWHLGLFNVDGLMVEDLGELTKDIISGTDFRWYKQYTITANVTGKHFFGVFDDVLGTAIYQSSLFNLITQSEVLDYTLVEYKHSTNRDNYNYESIDIYNSVFLDLVNLPNTYEYTNKVVIDAVTGDVRTQKNQQSTILNFETQLFDHYANEVMSSLSGHDNVLLNKEPVTIKEGHKAEGLRDYNQSNGVFSAYHNAKNRINLNG